MIKEIKLGYVSAYLVGEKKYALIDTGMKGNQDKILKALEDMGVAPKDIQWIILTHFHEDHVGSAKEMRHLTGAKIIMHKTDADTLKGTVQADIKALSPLFKLIYVFTGGKQKLLPLIPDKVFEGEYDLSEIGIKGKLIETPGHTKGSISFVTGKEAVIGDTYMAFNRKKGPRMPIIAYDTDKIKDSMEMLLNMGIRTIYLSHGGKFSMTVL